MPGSRPQQDNLHAAALASGTATTPRRVGVCANCAAPGLLRTFTLRDGRHCPGLIGCRRAMPCGWPQLDWSDRERPAPFHPDDGNAFFQLARTVIQQAGFALEVDIEEPDRLLTHYDRVTHLLQRFVQLSNIYHQNDTVTAWIQAIIQTQHRIRHHLAAALPVAPLQVLAGGAQRSALDRPLARGIRARQRAVDDPTL
jgi:hypothetical protein